MARATKGGQPPGATADEEVADRPSRLPKEAFVARFGSVFEHSPWIAAAAWEQGLGPDADTAEGLHARLCAVLRAADETRQLELIRAHPDLAGRLALANQLTPESTAEQTSAGLDRLSPAELARFTELNEAYKARFGFPFVIAVKGRSTAEILEAFEARLRNGAAAELATALEQIERIALLRLEALLPS
jgi:urate oxidase